MAAFGAPTEMLDSLKEASVSEEFEVLPENWPIVDLFLRLQTQWRFSGMGSATGLDYNAVDVVMRRLRIEDGDGAIFAGLQVMEVAALNAVRD